MTTTTNTGNIKAIKYFEDRGYAAELTDQYMILTRIYDEQYNVLVTTYNGVIHLELRFPLTALGAAAQAAVIATVRN